MRQSPKRATPDKELRMIAGAALAAFLAHTEPARSAEELPTGTSWSGGIEDMHRRVVLDKSEIVRWYLKGSSKQWVTPTTSGAPDERMYERNAIEKLPKSTGVKVVCEFHDHVLETFLRAQRAGYAPREPSAETIQSFRREYVQNPSVSVPPVDSPPSFGFETGDTSPGRHARLLAQLRVHYGPNVELEHGIKTLQGIWYFRPLPSAGDGHITPDLSQGERPISPPAILPVQEKTLKYLEALRYQTGVQEARSALVDEYEALNVRVRFVPNDQIEKEPDCAGADYIPR